MDRTYWHRQSPDQPLFADLIWSRPEKRAQAGKLLIVGCNAHGFAAPAEAYAEALQAGIGSARVLLPDSLQRTVAKLFPEAEFAPSTPSGSFARQALSQLLEAATWADGVLLAGDFGRNSETSILIEEFLNKYPGQVTLSPEASGQVDRGNTLLVLNLTQLQKIATAAKFPKAFTSNMDFLPLVETLHEFSQAHRANFIVKHQDNILVAVNGEISSTKSSGSEIKIAAHAAVWWLQNPTRPFEAVTSSLV
jgi:thiamine pyrophosphate-dependent acetolactate synthase large subunit-like protein